MALFLTRFTTQRKGKDSEYVEAIRHVCPPPDFLSAESASLQPWGNSEFFFGQNYPRRTSKFYLLRSNVME